MFKTLFDTCKKVLKKRAKNYKSPKYWLLKVAKLPLVLLLKDPIFAILKWLMANYLTILHIAGRAGLIVGIILAVLLLVDSVRREETIDETLDRVEKFFNQIDHLIQEKLASL